MNKKNKNLKSTGKPPQKIVGSQRGATAIEFALILPVLAALLFGIVDFGRLLYTVEVLNNAVREGARQGIIKTAGGVSDADIENVVLTSIAQSQLVDPSQATITITRVPATGSPVPGAQDLTVGLTYNFNFLVVGNGLINGLGASSTLNAQSVMRTE
jgi:Flp pilus assembly protein TadG